MGFETRADDSRQHRYVPRLLEKRLIFLNLFDQFSAG